MSIRFTNIYSLENELIMCLNSLCRLSCWLEFLKPKDAVQYVILGDLTASSTGSEGGDESLGRELSR